MPAIKYDDDKASVSPPQSDPALEGASYHNPGIPSVLHRISAMARLAAK
jgi:hypothetical protein